MYLGSRTVPNNGTEGSPGPLGISARIVSAPNADLRRQDALARRFTLQSTARDLLPSYRITNCLRVPFDKLVWVLHHPGHDRASFGGLQTCGSVHVCSCCGTKIAERRAGEISAAVTSWLDQGGTVFMATFTLQHADGDPLVSIAGTMNEAYRKMRAGRAWQRFEQSIGLVGSITAREYTHGGNGWHPHLHALLFTGQMSGRLAKRASEWLSFAWGEHIQRLGHYAHPKYGVDCRLSEDQAIAEYVTKTGKSWTVADELAKANRKLGRRGSHTVPELLWRSSLGDERAGRLFVEYASCTFHKNALVWTPGLRGRLLQEPEKSDEQIAEEQTADAEFLVCLLQNQWREVLANDARAELLQVAAAGDVGQVVRFLEGLGIELEGHQILG